ncbi:MAG TPA: hypothetical protein VGH76_00720 [Actinomycetospora sp.]|jgi:uncharacterized protein (DUF849 family)|uniref:hypothetical protein n=1 Tax=Actinomycetospora sp. TaxID=1872135 RepID=UPI002F416799
MAVDADPVILEVALNGATGPEQNPHVLLDEAVSLLAARGRRPATSAEAREMLGVPRA